MPIQDWMNPKRLVALVATLSSLEFAINASLAYRSAMTFEFWAWFAGAVLVYALAGLVESVKVGEDR